jgi:DNA-binding MarR family transcriptional regulator
MEKSSSIPNIIDRFWETIPEIWHQTRNTIRRVAVEQFKMTVEQFQILRRIRKGFDEVSSLAVSSQTSRSAVSKVVDGLVTKGLVTRLTDTQDRRHVHLALTEEGARLMNGIYSETEKWLAAKFQTLTTDELEQASDGMDLLRKLFE